MSDRAPIRDEADLWYIRRRNPKEYIHPTQKPLGLIRRGLKNSTRKGDLVLDPFAGSGSTMIAADSMDRRAALMELDPKYCDVIRRRYEQYVRGRGKPRAAEAAAAA